MRFTEQFHQPNVEHSNYSQAIQNELLASKNRAESVSTKVADKSEAFLSLKDIENPYIYNNEDRNSPFATAHQQPQLAQLF